MLTFPKVCIPMLVSLICVLQCFAEDNGTSTKSKILFFADTYSHEEMVKTFEGKENRLQYFLEEITNNIDGVPQFFFDYVNPETSDEQFTEGKLSIYKKILWMKDIEKSAKERRAIHDIDRFLSMNYNTQRLPAIVYSNSQNNPRPFTVAQLVNLAFNAIPNNDINALRALIENYNLVNAKDELGNSLLMHAVMLKKNDIAMFLIHSGADIDSPNAYGTTPLIAAVQAGNVEEVRMLVKYGCNINKKDNSKRSARDYAASDSRMLSLLTKVSN